MSNFALVVIGVSAVTFTVSGGYSLAPRVWYDPSCNIKGNISFNADQKIYHVPGQEHYVETVISPGKGEKWFCSEADAIAAGWRKAGR